MNKTYLIVAGSSVVSLAAGAVGGYFFAKKRFDELLDRAIDTETAKTRTHYGVRMTNMKYGQKPPLEELAEKYNADEVVLDEDARLPLEAEDVVEKPKKRTPPERVDYQSFAKTDPSDIIESNIFSNQSGKPVRPARDPQSGKFMPKQTEEVTQPADSEPYPITEHDFMVNEVDGEEHDQESVIYFVNEDTAVMASDYNEVVANERLGQFHLNKLKNGTADVIYIRHEGLQIDYQVTRTTDSLVEALGLGESESDVDEIDASEHRIAREDEESSAGVHP